MPNDEEVLYDPGASKQAKTPGETGEIIYDPAATSAAPSGDSQPITAPKLSDFVPDSNTIPNLAKGAGQGVINMGKGIVNTVLHPIDAAEGIGKTLKDTYREAKSGQYLPAAATALGMAGFDEPHLAQLWNQGEGSRAIGEATPMAIADAVTAEKMAGRGDLTIGGKNLKQHAIDLTRKAVIDPGTGQVAVTPKAVLERVLREPQPPVMGPTRMNPEDIADPNAYTPQGPTRVNPEQYAEEQNRVTPQGPTRINKPVDELREQIRAGNAARLPVRMAPPEEPPPLVYGPTRINETPGGLIPEEPGPIQGPARVNEADLKEYTPQGPTRVNPSSACCTMAPTRQPW